MANIIKDSSTRIKTGVVMIIAVLLVGFLDKYILFWILFGGLMIVGIKEVKALMNYQSNDIYVVASIFWAIAYFYPKPEDLLFVIVIVVASIVAFTKEHDYPMDFEILKPLLYPFASFLFLLSLYNEFGVQALLWMLVIVAGTDIGAYFVGKSIGKHKFCATSPNKTMEGVIGGILTGSLLGSVVAIDTLSFEIAIVISLVVAIASVFGDLFESYLKREADIKDSGDIFPGHGGVLDRTDGYLFGGVILLVLLRGLGV
jgi:phosphatidate cytidylyltransferase